MNGINCRNCNKTNPLGSKFCNNCGTALPPQTTQICSNCGTANPQNRLYCDSCGHRLVAAAPRPNEEKPASETPSSPPARHGFSLPSRRPGDTGELDPDDLPDWLKTGERPTAEPDPERQTRITGWLQELTELKDEEETEQPFTIDYGFLERPKWPGRSREEQAETPSPTSPTEANLPSNIFDDILSEAEQTGQAPPDWLTEPSQTATPAEETPTNDWMPSLQTENKVTSAESEWSETGFPPLSEEPPSEQSDAWPADFDEVTTKSESDDSTPDWLAELATHAPDNLTQPDDETWLTDAAATPYSETDLAPNDAPEEWGAGFTLDRSSADTTSENSDNEWLARLDQTEDIKTDYASVTAWLADLDNADTTGESTTSTESPLDSWDDEVEYAPSDSLTGDEALESAPSSDLSAEELENITWDEAPAQDDTIVADWLHELDETSSNETGVVSDWLADFQADEETDDEAAAADSHPDDPDQWLVAEEPAAFTSEPEPQENTPEPDSTLPDDFDLTNWLQELETQADTEDDVAAVSATHLVEDDLPEWLPDESLTRSVTADQTPAEPIAPELVEVPDWLTELRTSDTTFFAAPEEETTTQETPTSISSWLDDLSVAEPPPSSPDPFLPEREPEPAWDPTDEEDFALTPQREGDGVTEGLVRAELPDWLQESLAEGNILATSGSQPHSMELPDLPLPQDDLPEWLNTPTEGDFDSALEAALSVQGSEMVGGTLSSEWMDILGDMPASAELIDLEQADIPEWIQELKPRELTGMAPEADEEPEQLTGPLEGMRGVIPIEPIIAQPKTNIAAANPYIVTKEQQQQAALLHQLIHAEPKMTTTVGMRPQAMPVWVRLTLSISLLLAVLLGLFLPWFDINLPLVLPEPLSGVSEAKNSIAAAAGSTALVAFEYTPGMAGELDPQAQLIINQLAASGKQIVAVSQFAAGLGQAKALGFELADSQFIPGEAIGLRSLADCLENATDCSLSLNPENVGIIVVLTAERDSLIGWIEQVGTQTEIPLVIGTTQGLAPVAQPYLSSGQVDGLIAGLPGAAAYEQAVSGQPGETARQLQAQTLAQLLVIGIFIGGALYYGLIGGRRNR